MKKIIAGLNPKKLTILYIALMTAYWSSVCCICGFASVLLTARDFSNSSIGLIMASGNIVAVLLSPSISAIADRARQIKIHTLTLITAAILSALCALLIFIGNNTVLIGVLFVITIAFIQVLQPLTNSISIYYVNHGIEVNFGLSRAMGSVAYGIISSALGVIVARFSTDFILYGALVSTILLIIITMLFPTVRDDVIRSAPGVTATASTEYPTEKSQTTDRRRTSLLAFIHKYPRFCMVLAGIILMFVFHNILNYYMFQFAEAIGGNAKTMGNALMISAFVELPPMIFFMRLYKKFGSRKLLIFSAIFFSLKALGYALVRTEYFALATPPARF